jgi:general secretion pathway protein G
MQRFRKAKDHFINFSREAGEAGMSMIEIMIVVSLIGILMAYIVRNVMGAADNAKKDQTKIVFNMLMQDLQRYKLDNNKYPTSDQGLQALLSNPGGEAKNWRGPYTEDNKIQDPWGEKIGYESDGRTIKLQSSGPNQTMGDEDDLFYPEAKQGEGAASGQ